MISDSQLGKEKSRTLGSGRLNIESDPSQKTVSKIGGVVGRDGGNPYQLSKTSSHFPSKPIDFIDFIYVNKLPNRSTSWSKKPCIFGLQKAGKEGSIVIS